MKNNKWTAAIGAGFTAAVGETIEISVCAFFIKILWNLVIPEIFNLQDISFWQAVGLYLLPAFLFNRVGKGDKKNE